MQPYYVDKTIYLHSEDLGCPRNFIGQHNVVKVQIGYDTATDCPIPGDIIGLVLAFLCIAPFLRSLLPVQ